MTQYQITKEQCQKSIHGVCEGCGGKLEPIETVNNSGNPTYWVGCNHCSCFRSGVEREYFEIARELIEGNEMVQYSHMKRRDYEDDPDRLLYWLDSQTAGLSRDIKMIHRRIEEKFKLYKELP